MKIVTFLFFLTASLYTFATPRPIPPLIKKLREIPGSVQFYYQNCPYWFDIPDLPENFKNEPQHLLKSDSGFFITIPGTGRLYKFIFEKDKMDIQRMDSTYFGGYNFNSISFNVGNQIYSFGGEGFWRVNGQLRYFDTSIHEWNAIKTNRHIHRAFHYRSVSWIYSIDTSSKTLIINGSLFSDEYLKDQKPDSGSYRLLYQLDLRSGNWTDLGSFQPNGHDDEVLAACSLGLLTKYYVLNLKQNRKYSHKKFHLLSGIQGMSRYYHRSLISFAYGSTIYFGNEWDRIDSITITPADLTDTGEPVYYVDTTSDLTNIKWMLLGIPLFLITAFYYFNQRNNRKTIEPSTVPEVSQPLPLESLEAPAEKVLRSGLLNEVLSHQQLEFLRQLYDNTFDERMTTIEEINRLLGTQNKTVEIQKKLRSDMINGINDRLSLSLGIKTPVINKQRSEFDKRSFEYFIHSQHMDLVRDLVLPKKD